MLLFQNSLECNYGEVPLSIQKGYTLLLRPDGGCTPTEYRVYAHLSRAGYRVTRHLPNLTVSAYERQIRLDQHLELNKIYKLQGEEAEIPRPDLPPVKTLDLSNNTELLIEAYGMSTNQSKKTSLSVEENCVEPALEVVDLLDTSSEESSEESSNNSDIEILEEYPAIRNVIQKQGNKESQTSSDDDIIEVPVLKKQIVVETIESSDSDNDINSSGSETDKSNDGNFKRTKLDKKKPFVRPPSLSKFNYPTVESFLNNKRGKSLHSFDSEENSNIGNQRARSSFPAVKSREEILDMMPSMAKQKIMSIERPDLRFIPASITPKQQLYTYNTNFLRARVFSNRPAYRGNRHFHYPSSSNSFQPFSNNINCYNSWLLGSSSLMPHNMFGQDVQAVAENMIQFASALLNNRNFSQNNQSNGNFSNHFSPNQSSFLGNNSYHRPRFNYNEPSRSFAPGTPRHFSPGPRPVLNEQHRSSPATHIRFSDSTEFFIDRSPQTTSSDRGINESVEVETIDRRVSAFTQGMERNCRPYHRGQSRRSFPRKSNPRFVELKHQRNQPAIDPAYVKPDIPLYGNMISRNLEERVSPVDKNSVEVIDISGDDSNFIPVTGRGISSRFTKTRPFTKIQNKKQRKRSKRVLKKKMIELKGRNKNSPSRSIVLNSLNSPSTNVPVKMEEDEDTDNTSDVCVKTETEGTVVKQEADNIYQLDNVKHERLNDLQTPVKVEGDFIAGHIKSESNNGGVIVKLEHDNLLKEFKQENLTDSSLPLVKTEQSLAELLPSKSSTNISEEMELSHSATGQIASSTTSPDEHTHNNTVQINNESIFNEECQVTDVIKEDIDESKNSATKLEDPCKRNKNPTGTNIIVSTECSAMDIEIIGDSSDVADLIGHVSTGVEDCGTVKNWAEMKNHNVVLERSEESSEEESGEDNEEIDPLIKPRHCKSIGKFKNVIPKN